MSGGDDGGGPGFLARDLLREVTDAQRSYLRARNLGADVKVMLAARRLRPAPRLRPPTFRVALVLAAGATALVLGWGLRPQPLTFTVGAVAGRAGGEIANDTGEAALPMLFSDGSSIDLGALAEVQVTEVESRGALVQVRRGRVHVNVPHREGTGEDGGARWRFRTGPFEVKVTGTRFDLGWDPGPRSMSLTMLEGSVEVRQDGRPDLIRVRAGQRLLMNDGAVEWGIEPASVRAGGGDPGGGEGGGAAASGADQAQSWQRLALAGRYEEALAAVEREGFDDACRRLGAEELVLLGDVARLAQDGTRADRAYRTARRRFPRVDRPLFTLGLVAFEQRRDFVAAARWFERYGQEFPRGALASEAAGRALESWHRAGRHARARSAALTYLARAPGGPYAALARRVATGLR
jgi:hypothetical protein